MKCILDSHVLLWFCSGDRRLPRTARAVIEQASTTPIISIVTTFELAIKSAKGLLKLGAPIDSFVQRFVEANRGELLPILPLHCRVLESMPRLHGDPFDRMLAAQAKHDNLPVITIDDQIANYGVTRIW